MSPRDNKRGATVTFLYDFPDEDLGETCHDLCHGHGHLLAEALLNYLPRRRVRTWASRVLYEKQVVPYLANGLFREGMTAICLETFVLLRRKVVHEHPRREAVGGGGLRRGRNLGKKRT